MRDEGGGRWERGGEVVWERGSVGGGMWEVGVWGLGCGRLGFDFMGDGVEGEYPFWVLG